MNSSWRQLSWDPRPVFLLLNTCGYSPYVTSSLTGESVCYLQLLLVLASAVILGSESLGNHDHILLSHIRDFPTLDDEALVFLSPRNRVTQLHPQRLGSISSPPMTLRATVVIFETASTRGIFRVSCLSSWNSFGTDQTETLFQQYSYCRVSLLLSRTGIYWVTD
jgi:hypothetical protein